MISVIIPLYNKENTVVKTIESVLLQVYVDFEIVVVNDGSSDNSVALVHSLSDERIRIIDQKNAGVSSARNKGIEEALGEWIVFLDADDILLPNCLEMLHSLVIKYKVRVAAGNFYTYDLDGDIYPFIFSSQSGIITDLFRSFFFKQFYLRMGNSIFHKDLFKNNKFDTKLSRYEDYKLFFSILRSVKQIAVSQVPIMEYTHEFGDLANKFDNLERDFISQLNFSHKSFWEKMSLGLLYSQGLKVYKKDYQVLLDRYRRYNFIRLTAVMLIQFVKIKRKYYRKNYIRSNKCQE